MNVNVNVNTNLDLDPCDTIGIVPLGDIAITGPAAMPIHVKPLLDKLGVTADFLHVGAYKGRRRASSTGVSTEGSARSRCSSPEPVRPRTR